MRWEFDPDIPTHDFLEEGPLDDIWNLQAAVENFVSGVEGGQFLAWFKNGRFRVALGISARTLIGPARWSGFT